MSTNGEDSPVINDKIKQYFIQQALSIMILMVLLLFVFYFLFHSKILYSESNESEEQGGDVSINFEFDIRLQARPFRVFLKRTEELNKGLKMIDSDRVQLFEAGKLIYDFPNMKPGTYWVGFSFKYLLKNVFPRKTFIEEEYEHPPIVNSDTGGDEKSDTDYNRIEVKKNKKVWVDLKIGLYLLPRLELDEQDDPVGIFKFKLRKLPKSPEEELMLDENYFVQGDGWFDFVKRRSSKDMEYVKIFFELRVFDDYPFLHCQ